MKRFIPALGALVLLVGASGCYKAVYKTGKPAGEPSASANMLWHMGVLNGLAEITQVPDMETLCPGGISEVRTQVDFVKGLVTNILGGILNFTDVTVICAAAGGGADGPEGYRVQVDEAGRATIVEPL